MVRYGPSREKEKEKKDVFLLFSLLSRGIILLLLLVGPAKS